MCQDRLAINFDIPSEPLTLAAYIEDCRNCGTMHFFSSSMGRRHSTKFSIFLDLTGLICLYEECSFGVFSFLSNSYSMMLDMCAISVGCCIIFIWLFFYEADYIFVKGSLI